MFRRTLLGGILAVMASRAMADESFNVKEWMTTNGLVICDAEISTFKLSPADESKFRNKYYTPLTFFIGTTRLSDGKNANIHWFIINQKIILPQSPSLEYDEHVRNVLYDKLDALLKGNSFKLAGLTTTGPYPSGASPYTFFIIGLDINVPMPDDLSQVVAIPDKPPVATEAPRPEPEKPTPVAPTEPAKQAVKETPPEKPKPAASKHHAHRRWRYRPYDDEEDERIPTPQTLPIQPTPLQAMPQGR